jgi:hypothetical protein
MSGPPSTSPSSQRRNRRRWLLMAVGGGLVVAVVAAVVVVAQRPDSQQDPAPPERPPQDPGQGGSAQNALDGLFGRHVDEGVTTQLALDAFATLIAPIPGGTAEPGDLPEITSATPAARWMLARWDDLTDEQRDVFWRAVYGSERDTASGPLGFGGSLRSFAAGGTSLAQAADEDLVEQLESVVYDVRETFANISPLTVPEEEIVVRVDTDDESRAGARPIRSLAAPGDGLACQLTFYLPVITEFEEDELRREHPLIPIMDHLYLTTLAHEL